MYWRSYSQDDIVASYFGLDKAVNFSIVGDPAMFARQLLISQLAAALLVKSRIETFRSQNNFGTLAWQLGEIFPTGGWGSLEYAHSHAATAGQVRGGRWKPLHYWFESKLFGDVFVACVDERVGPWDAVWRTPGKEGWITLVQASPFTGLDGEAFFRIVQAVRSAEMSG